MADNPYAAFQAPAGDPYAAFQQPADAPERQGFLASLGAQLSALNPIPAIKAYFTGPSPVAPATDALAALNKIHADAAADTQNKGVPVNKWKLRDATPAERAAIDAGMSAQLASSSEGPGMLAPAMTAGGQVQQGDLPGAAGTLVGAAIPAVVAAAAPEVPGVTRKVVTAAKQPGTAAILKGVGTTGVGVGAMLTGSPEGLVLGASKALEGVGDVSKALAKRRAALTEAAARLRVPTAVPDIAPPPPGSMTIQPEAAIAAPPSVPATIPPYAPPVVSSTGPLPATAAPSVNPYALSSGSTLDSGALVRASQRAAEADAALAKPAAPQAAPGAPEGANAVLSPQEADWLKKRTADTAAKDETLATYAQQQGIAKIEAGKAYADFVADANKALGKKYQANITRADHPARVHALNDLLDSKNATVAATARAAELDKQGVSFADASKMTAAQLGVKTNLDVANTLFQLQKLKLGAAAPAAQAFKDALDSAAPK